jgi:hypothetical protein
MPSDGVVDQWAFAVESSSPRDFLLLHDLWRTLHRLMRSQMTSTISTAWDFTAQSGGMWKNHPSGSLPLAPGLPGLPAFFCPPCAV